MMKGLHIDYWQFNPTDECRTREIPSTPKRSPPGPYQPASLEQYFVENAVALGFKNVGPEIMNMSSGCDVWTNKSNSFHSTTEIFRRELKNYNEKVKSFRQIPDLRILFADDGSNRDEVCAQAELDPDKGTIQGFFNESGQLSHSLSGYIEPLFPPMRHPEFCFNESVLMDLGYLVLSFLISVRL